MKICENCGMEHTGEYGSGRFCSLKCTKGFSTKSKRKEINKKVSEKLKKPKLNLKNKCKFCNIEFSVSWRSINNLCCSKSCLAKLKWTNEDYRNKMRIILSASAKNQHSKKTGIGWKTRKKLEPSYPEKIAISFLDSLNIEYEREYKVDKYFVDFVLHKYMIAIEIDGQQHNKEDRKKIDYEKTILLEKLGWKVYRISYPIENIKEKLNSILADIPSR